MSDTLCPCDLCAIKRLRTLSVLQAMKAPDPIAQVKCQLDVASAKLELAEKDNEYLRAKVKNLEAELNLNMGDEPDTCDCSHQYTCGFCRARASEHVKLLEKQKKARDGQLMNAIHNLIHFLWTPSARWPGSQYQPGFGFWRGVSEIPVSKMYPLLLQLMNAYRDVGGR